jgi:hypothetical protein
VWTASWRLNSGSTTPKSYTATWIIRYHYNLKSKWEIGEAFCIVEDEQRFIEQLIPQASAKSAPDN